MNVVGFRPREPLPMQWQGAEINAMLAACGDALDKGVATSWHVRSTEAGDPQLYLLGPAPTTIASCPSRGSAVFMCWKTGRARSCSSTTRWVIWPIRCAAPCAVTRLQS